MDMELEQYKNASLQTYKEAISRRNLFFILNVTLWLFVLYFSAYEDEIAALLSYVSVWTICAFRGIESIGEALAYFLDFISKAFTIAGISLAIFSKFWNTAFYSICLGILIQKLLYDMELRTRNFNSNLSVEISSQVTRTDASDQSRQLVKRDSRIQLQKMKQDAHITANKMNKLNGNNYESISPSPLSNNLLQSNSENVNVGQTEKDIRNEIKSLYKKWNNWHPDVSESSHGEIFSIKDFQSSFHDLSVESLNVFHDTSIKRWNDILEEMEESTQKCDETLLQSEMGSTYKDEEKANIASLCTLKAALLNLQELALGEFSKIKSEFDFDMASIERELKEKNDYAFKQSVTFNIETLKDAYLQDDMKQFDVIGNAERELKGNLIANIDNSEKEIASNDETVHVALLENDSKQLGILSNTLEYFDEPENKVEKDIFNEIKNISSNTYSDRTLDFIQSNDSIRNKSCTNQTCNIRNQESIRKISSMNSAIDQEKSHEPSLQEMSFETIEEDFGDRSSKTMNHSANDAEDSKMTKQSAIKKTIGDVDSTIVSRVSNVEDVVNRIDLSFIYDLFY